jgi:hypothetical protein
VGVLGRRRRGELGFRWLRSFGEASVADIALFPQPCQSPLVTAAAQSVEVDVGPDAWDLGRRKELVEALLCSRH